MTVTVIAMKRATFTSSYHATSVIRRGQISLRQRKHAPRELRLHNDWMKPNACYQSEIFTKRI